MARNYGRFLTWNIQWACGSDGRVDVARVARAARSFDAEVLCLQEVAVNQPGLPGGAGGDQAAALASQFAGYEAVYAAGSDVGDGAGGRRQFGQLLLSRLPVLQVFRHLLPWPADPHVPSMPRVALEAVVKLPAESLRIVTTHLEFYSSLQRHAQVDALRAIHAEGWRHARQPRSGAEADPPFAVLPRGECTVLCGDFNCLPGTPEYRNLEAAHAEGPDVPRLLDAWPLLHPDQGHPQTAGLHTPDWPGAPGCYDFFFVSENLVPRLKGVFTDAATQASDHQPVVLEVAF